MTLFTKKLKYTWIPRQFWLLPNVMNDLLCRWQNKDLHSYPSVQSATWPTKARLSITLLSSHSDLNKTVSVICRCQETQRDVFLTGLATGRQNPLPHIPLALDYQSVCFVLSGSSSQSSTVTDNTVADETGFKRAQCCCGMPRGSAMTDKSDTLAAAPDQGRICPWISSEPRSLRFSRRQFLGIYGGLTPNWI